jgi:hypothetical protein
VDGALAGAAIGAGVGAAVNQLLGGRGEVGAAIAEGGGALVGAIAATAGAGVGALVAAPVALAYGLSQAAQANIETDYGTAHVHATARRQAVAATGDAAALAEFDRQNVVTYVEVMRQARGPLQDDDSHLAFHWARGTFLGVGATTDSVPRPWLAGGKLQYEGKIYDWRQGTAPVGVAPVANYAAAQEAQQIEQQQQLRADAGRVGAPIIRTRFT